MSVYDKPVYDEDIMSMPVYDKPVYDEDIMLMPVYDKPVYDEDILSMPVYELPRLMSKSSLPSVIFDDAAESEGVGVDDDEEYDEAEGGNHDELMENEEIDFIDRFGLTTTSAGVFASKPNKLNMFNTMDPLICVCLQFVPGGEHMRTCYFLIAHCGVDDNGLGYDDEGHEEDWSIAGAAFSFKESEGEFERSKKKKKSIVDDVIVKFEDENFELKHDKEGYDLSWSSFKEGYLLSGSNDCKTCLWDVSAMPQEKVLDAKFTYEGHENVVSQRNTSVSCRKHIISVNCCCRSVDDKNCLQQVSKERRSSEDLVSSVCQEVRKGI
ncbi:hypothetical protein SASPL_133612 [Salvia splendens]|uniref:Uncharacterized protein n=1 Tax=Salvia splendens TaxID=180675 RepID=A0A8X8ZIH8_SALSN|nr:hypothetical protein SASPL_133612 [Salvia splendens]